MIDTPEVVVATPQPTEDESLGAITIQFNYNDWVPEDVQVYELLISQFNQEHQGEIFVEADHNQDELYPRGYYVEKSNSYDCYLTQAVRYGAEKAVLSGAVLDLTALFEGEDSTFQQDFDNYLLDASRYKGYLTALPLSTQPAIMVYNADLLNEQGLQAPTLDWTFDDFLGLITAVTSTSGSDKHYGFLPSTNAANPLDMLYAGHGLQWRDITGTSPVVLLNTPQMAGTLSWYNELEQTGVVYQITNEEDWELGIGMPVRSGQISFFITYAEEEEEMYFSFIEPPFTLGIAPLPDTDKPNGAFARNYITGFFISKYSENPEACWEFAKYLLEHTEVLNGVPARTSIANSLTWEAQIGAEKAAVYRKALSNNLTNIEADPYGAYYWSPIRSWIGQATMNIRDGNNPTQELALAQQYADAYIECMAAFDIVNLDTDELSEATQNCALQVDPSY
jgi:ABC-type glycerol-3-phosphate transport system substrate-binding protein